MDVTLDLEQFRRPWAFVAAETAKVKEQYKVGNDAYTRINRGNLSNFVLLDAVQSPARLVSRRDGVWVEVVAAGVRVDAPGRVLLLPGDLQKLFAVRPRIAEVRLRLNDTDLTELSWGRSRAVLRHPPADAFPAPAPVDPRGWYTVMACDLARAIRRVEWAAEPKSSRYALAGICVEAGEGMLNLVATDGTRIAHATCPSSRAGVPLVLPASIAPVVPTQAMRQVGDLLGMDPDGEARLAFLPGGSFAAWVGAGTLRTPLVEGRFPAWRTHLPPLDSQPCRVSFPGPAELRRAVEAAQSCTTAEHEGVDFAIRTGQVILRSEAPDAGRAWVEVPLDGCPDGPEFSLDGRLILHALRALDDGDPFELACSDDRSAVSLRAEGVEIALMPLVGTPTPALTVELVGAVA